MKKKKIGLSFLVIALALSVAFSFVAISHLLIKTGRANSYTSVDISADDSAGNTPENSAEQNGTQNENVEPEIEILGGKGGVYHKEIQIFYTEYGEDGNITVKSAFDDKIVAPGTENSYDLFVRNVGEVPISYILEAESDITVTVNAEQFKIPVESTFSAPNNNYLLGDNTVTESLAKLDGIKDGAGLSPRHEAKYTLYWNWPFDGDDEFDTMLGNLAAEGDDLTVKVAFNITAAYDPDAEGGSPITGDKFAVGFWVSLFVISLFSMLIILFRRKNEQNEEGFQTRE